MSEDIINKIAKELKGPILYMNKINLERLKNLRETVFYIMKKNIVDEKIIERTFDDLLDLTYFYGEDLNNIYFLFLNYYENINSEASNDYKKLYLEILNE